MKKGIKSNKKITLLVIALMLIVTLFSAFAVMGSASAEAVIADGRSFTIDDELSLVRDLTSVPKTFEATIRIPKGTNKTSVIFGNNSAAGGTFLNFEITTAGKPRLHMRDDNGNVFDIGFGTDIRSDSFVHIAVTHSVLNDGSSSFVLYVNGAKKETKTHALSCELDPVLLQREVTLMLARDGRWRNEHYFKGNIKNVGLYSEPLSAAEILNVYQSGFGASVSSRMAYYDLTLESNNSGKQVKDSCGKGYNFESIFYPREDAIGDYDYAFAVVGDTQCLVEHDTEYQKAYTNAIYDWLVKNKDSKKIKYVLGLGDITQDDLDAEWTTGKNQIIKLNGNIPYSLVNGNHDSVKQLDNYFAADVNFTSQEIGYYSGTSLGNYYVKFTAGGNKYMVVALQFAMNNAVLEWANHVIGTNPEYQVIITTHAYLDANGEVLEAGDGGAPSHYNKNNPDGDDMWEKLVSKNRNIKMIFSGHIAADNIVYRSDVGEEGNTVYQLLVNPQSMDHTYMYETGMVAMLYFSNGGNTVKIEYISTYDSLKAQEADKNAEDVLFGRKNQFTLDLTPKAPENKGEINVWLIGGQSNAVGYANDLSAYVGKDSRYINGFDNVLYYGYGEQWQSNFTPAKIGLGQNNKKSGIEIGIANALGNTGEMNAIIKYAEGGTYLAPTNAAKGTWTSPTYISENGISTSGNKIGYLYNSFIDTVESAIYELRAMGYTPVIQGMWWMQGCAESYDSYSLQYEALLRALIKDVRTDVEERTGVETTDMPFVFGKIIFNPNGEKIPAGYLDADSYYNKVLAAQSAVANDSNLKNVTMVDAKSDFSGFAQVDTWHYNAATQDYLGVRFVNEVNAINGKCVVSGNGANATISGGGLYSSGDSVTVTFNALPGFAVTGVSMSVGGAAATSINLINSKYTFTSNGQNVIFTIKTTGGTSEQTSYGTIPAEYPASEYPFAIFKSGSFLSAKANWTSALAEAYNELRGTAGAGKSVTILLRRDYTTCVLDASTDYLTHFNGSFTFDLGGKTFTRADGYLFDIYASVTDSKLFTTSIALKNGTVIAAKAPLIGLNHSASSSLNGSLKNFDFDFENVRFEIAKGTSIGSGFITACWENQNYGMTADLKFTDCTFDFTNAVGGSVMINLAGDTKSLTNVKLDISGGNIIASKSAIKFIKTDNGDVVGLSKNDTGSYITLTAPAGADITAFSGSYVSSDLTKTLLFELDSENQSEKHYKINESEYVTPIETEYGIIPELHYSADSSPFVLFDMTKAYSERFVGGYADLGAAMAEIAKSYVNNKSADLVILMRKNADKTTKADIAYFTGKLKIDLGGYKLSLTSAGSYVFDFYVNTASSNGLRGTYTVYNGIIDRVGGNAIANTNYSNTGLTQTVGFKFIFDTVTFRSTLKSDKSLITFTWEGDGTGKTANNGSEHIDNIFDFRNCVLDYKNSAEGTVMLRLKYTTDADRVKYTVTFAGGKIISDKVISSLVEMNTGTDRADSFEFTADSNGKYTTLEMTCGLAPISETFNSNSLVFTKTKTENGYDTYELMKHEDPVAPELTEYGEIPIEYASAESYPLVIFSHDTQKDSYKFESAKTSWKDALAEANKFSSSLILLRRDYTTSSGDATSSLLRTYSGNVTVDLNGKTICRSAGGAYLFDFYLNGSATAGELNYTLKNGTVNIEKWAIDFSGYSSCTVDKAVNFTFDNVTFKLSNNFVSSDGGWLFSIWTNASNKKEMTTKMVFNDCAFDDTARNSVIATTPLLSFNSSAIRVKADVQINGGSFKTNALDKDLIYTIKQFSDEYPITVSFDKGSDGAMMKFEQSSTSKTPDFTLNDGRLVFVKIFETVDTVAYRLNFKEAAKLNYAPKMSITLDNEFVMNVYVPVNYTQEFTFNGNTYNSSNSYGGVIKDIDGKDYYLVKAALGSSAAASELKLVASVNNGEISARATFTFSIPKYAAKLLANGNETEKALARDVLAYIKAAYEYFGTAHGNTEAEIARVSALIKSIIGDYTAAPTTTGSTTAGVSGVTSVTLNLDAKPTIRFYVTDMNVTFKIGDKVLDVDKNETEGYVELDVYAYALCETITYGNGGSYHISDFVTRSAGTANEALVKAFVKYTESAADYRNAVIGVKN